MSKEKNTKKLFIMIDIIIIFCSFLSLVITGFITGQNRLNGVFYFDGVKMWQSPSYYIISIICLLVFPIILFLQLKKDIKNFILCFSIGIITFFLSFFIYLLFSGSGDRSEHYYNFSSPINGRTMVAEEWSWLQGGGVNFYEPLDEEKMHRIGYISTDDGYRPLKDNSYSFKWSENEVTISYSYRGNGKSEVWKTDTIKFSTIK